MRNSRASFLWLVVAVVLANYIAQIPYAVHLHKHPSLASSALLGSTLIWFLCGYVGLVLGSRVGYWILVSYLATVVAFYSYNILNQVAHGFPPFMHLQERDPILFVVFAIGYVNLLAGVYFLYRLLRCRRALLTRPLSRQARSA